MDQPPGEKPGRLPALDLIRGIAVLGILPVNISVFSGIGFYPPAEGDHWSNVLAAHAVTLLFEGKMVTLLSLLFGVGLAMQAGQAQAAGQRFAPFGRRRMAVLFLLGLAHALLLFQFDILTSYAVAGFIALLFLQRHERVLRRVAVVCFTWSFGLLLVLAAAVVLINLWLGPLEDAATAADETASATVSDSEEPFAEETLWLERFFAQEYEAHVFLEGTFGERVLFRAVYLVLLTILFWLETGWYILGCMMVGAWLLRREAFHSAEAAIPLSRRFMVYGITTGVILHTAALAADIHEPENMYSWSLVMLGCLPLALGYLGLLMSWSRSDRLGWLQVRLRDVGRMSLSNYLLQSILCGFVFFGYGLRLYNQLGYAAVLGVVLAIWILLILGSWFWLKRFRHGPAEWLWRRLARQARPTHASPG